MLAERRDKFNKIETKVGEIFSRLNLSPNQFTLNSVFFGFFAVLFLFYKNFLLALIFFIVSFLLDFIDGAVARYTNTVTKHGAYLDTISDRFVEGLVYFGFLSLPLPKIILESQYWIFLAFFGSLMTTYAKAAAKEKNLVVKELKKGILGRAERTILISISLLLANFNVNWSIYPLIILAVFSNLTALQRIILGLKQKE